MKRKSRARGEEKKRKKNPQVALVYLSCLDLGEGNLPQSLFKKERERNEKTKRKKKIKT
jgi:hypothetical protein